MKTQPSFSNPQAIAEAGERIYKDRYQSDYEQKYHGHFVAIDVTSEKSYIAEQPEDVLEKAREESPDGIFHLIKIGATGAFRVSYSSNVVRDWVL